MDTKNFRKINALTLADEHGGISALARMAESTQSYFSQMLGLNGKREVGDEIARRLEVVCNKPHGWMDRPNINEVKLQKARQIYEGVLRFNESQLDALITLLGFAEKTVGALGPVNFDELKSMPSKKIESPAVIEMANPKITEKKIKKTIKAPAIKK